MVQFMFLLALTSLITPPSERVVNDPRRQARAPEALSTEATAWAHTFVRVEKSSGQLVFEAQNGARYVLPDGMYRALPGAHDFVVTEGAPVLIRTAGADPLAPWTVVGGFEVSDEGAVMIAIPGAPSQELGPFTYYRSEVSAFGLSYWATIFRYGRHASLASGALNPVGDPALPEFRIPQQAEFARPGR